MVIVGLPGKSGVTLKTLYFCLIKYVSQGTLAGKKTSQIGLRLLTLKFTSSWLGKLFTESCLLFTATMVSTDATNWSVH
jgi:hypothetical protein